MGIPQNTPEAIPPMSLTEMAVRNAKPKDRPFKLTDGGGLHLVVQPAGGKLWRMKYRFAGREKLLSFGPYPTTTLAEARRKRDDAKKLIHDGTDPAVQKRVEKITAAIAERNTFGALVEEFLAAKEANGVSPSTIVKLKWLLTEVAAPLSTRPVSAFLAWFVKSPARLPMSLAMARQLPPLWQKRFTTKVSKRLWLA